MKHANNRSSSIQSIKLPQSSKTVPNRLSPSGDFNVRSGRVPPTAADRVEGGSSARRLASLPKRRYLLLDVPDGRDLPIADGYSTCHIWITASAFLETWLLWSELENATGGFQCGGVLAEVNAGAMVQLCTWCGMATRQVPLKQYLSTRGRNVYRNTCCCQI